MNKHIDRWNELLLGEKFDAEGWSEPKNLATWSDYLMFDLFGEICFGKSHDLKEPGPNQIEEHARRDRCLHANGSHGMSLTASKRRGFE